MGQERAGQGKARVGNINYKLYETRHKRKQTKDNERSEQITYKQKTLHVCHLYALIIFIVVLCVTLDVDECKVSESFCDVNADCNNTRGSYRCLCKPGFTGDGKSCSGTSTLYV